MIKNGFARFGFFRTALAVNLPLVLATSAFAQAPSPALNETQPTVSSFNANGTQASRPTIVSAPSTAGLGSTISVSTNTQVSSFVIMRLSTVTHTVDNDQRRVPLVISSSTGNSYSLKTPSDPGIVPRGYYMLFAINAQGTPSVAQIIKVG